MKYGSETDALAQLTSLWSSATSLSAIEVYVDDLRFTHETISAHFRKGESFDAIPKSISIKLQHRDHHNKFPGFRSKWAIGCL